MDIATRSYNHTWKFDPIIRSLMDNDFYKFAMQQMIQAYHSETMVGFKLNNRTKTVRLSQEFTLEELREQLDHARTLRFNTSELIWLAGNTFYGQDRIFSPFYIEALKTYQLPEYKLERDSEGEFVLTFEGLWFDVTLWEIIALCIICELRTRSQLKHLSKIELDILYANAKSKLWRKIERLRDLKNEVGTLKIVDFGTRRRHSHLWQQWVIEAMLEGLGDQVFAGTSNMFFAKHFGIEAIGTNAHELPMVYASLARQKTGLDKKDKFNHFNQFMESQYRVLEKWEIMYDGNMRVFLPDTFGTTQFLKNAPPWIANWVGARPDSKNPFVATEELISWWKEKGYDPSQKLVILSDGMDIDSIEATARHFKGRVRLSYGWGTNLTNDFRGCSPVPDHDFKAISLVCKAATAFGHPCVKLSDNRSKVSAGGDKVIADKEIQFYLDVFGTDGMSNKENEV